MEVIRCPHCGKENSFTVSMLISVKLTNVSFPWKFENNLSKEHKKANPGKVSLVDSSINELVVCSNCNGIFSIDEDTLEIVKEYIEIYFTKED